MRRIRLSRNRMPRPQSSTPQLLETASRSLQARVVDGRDEHARDAAEPEAADRERHAVADAGDGLRGEETTLSMAGTLSATAAMGPTVWGAVGPPCPARPPWGRVGERTPL